MDIVIKVDLLLKINKAYRDKSNHHEHINLKNHPKDCHLVQLLYEEVQVKQATSSQVLLQFVVVALLVLFLLVQPKVVLNFLVGHHILP